MSATGRMIRVALLRRAFLDSGLTASEVCRRLEWVRPDGRPDTSRLRRALGIVPYHSRGYVKFADKISIARAELIADALDADPWEVGL